MPKATATPVTPADLHVHEHTVFHLKSTEIVLSLKMFLTAASGVVGLGRAWEAGFLTQVQNRPLNSEAVIRDPEAFHGLSVR